VNLDCGNAFNSIDRSPIALVLQCDDFNPLWSYWQLSYGSILRPPRSSASEYSPPCFAPPICTPTCTSSRSWTTSTSWADQLTSPPLSRRSHDALTTLYALLGKVGLSVRRYKCHVYGFKAEKVAEALNITHTKHSIKVLSACVSRDPTQASAALAKKLEAYQSIFTTLH
jgi:hypothetical protein